MLYQDLSITRVQRASIPKPKSTPPIIRDHKPGFERGPLGRLDSLDGQFWTWAHFVLGPLRAIVYNTK